jgi:hypothetical protein
MTTHSGLVRVLRWCWWCGRSAEVDTALREDNGLLRDDSSFAAATTELWTCIDSDACNQRKYVAYRW